MEEQKRKKNSFFQLRVNEDDRVLLNQLADENDMTVAELVMRMAKYFKSENLMLTFAPKGGTLIGGTSF